MKYSIEITEYLSRIVSIEANSPEETIDIMVELYQNNKIILSDGDFVNADYTILAPLDEDCEDNQEK